MTKMAKDWPDELVSTEVKALPSDGQEYTYELATSYVRDIHGRSPLKRSELKVGDIVYVTALNSRARVTEVDDRMGVAKNDGSVFLLDLNQDDLWTCDSAYNRAIEEILR